MANQNTFLCECGRVIGRPLANRHPPYTKETPDESYHGLPWDFVPGDAVHRGIQCGNCRRNYEWMKPSEGAPYVNVKKVDE